jgi:hypothetical protein
LLGQLKPDRATGLSLAHGGSINGITIWRNIIDPHGNNVAARQLAVDHQIEQGQIARLPGILEHRSNCPNVLRPQRPGVVST